MALRLAALLAACMFSISGSLIMWTTTAFDDFVANQVILDSSKGSFEWWINPPINPWFKVYIWNYTNWDEYLQNQSVKIQLQEVGPFTYKEVIRREDIKFDRGVSLSYTEVKNYTFMPELSGADLNDIVRVPSLPFFGANAKLAMMDKNTQNIGTFLGKGVDFLWTFTSTLATNLADAAVKPETYSHVTLRAGDFIHGYDDPIFTMSKVIASDVPMEQVGLLAKKPPDTMEILTGASDIDRLSYFVSYNGKKSLGAWTDPACNDVEGSDGSMFPPRKVRAKAPVLAFKAEACRQIQFVFQEETYAQGVPAYRYIIDRNTFMSPRTYPGNLCYCNQTDLEECAPDGLFDTSPCTHGAPTLISYPHFYLSEPAALEPFEGLSPDAEKHDMSADIHPRLGMTLQGKTRLQLNVRVRKGMKHLKKGLVLPVAWFAQDLPEYTGSFKTMLVMSTYGLNCLELVLLYVLPVLAVLSAALIVRRLAALGRERHAEAAMELRAPTSPNS